MPYVQLAAFVIFFLFSQIRVGNRTLEYMKRYFLLLLLLAGTKFSRSQDAALLNLGVKDSVYSTILKENRQLNIYLPPGYNAADTTRYPVVYLLDGGMEEDFIHITGLYQFSSFEWVNRVRPSIIVGIVNKDRRRDFTFPSTEETERTRYPTSGASRNFMQFLEKELQVFIDKKYNTSKERTLIGESLGGLLATEILFSRPALFTNYIIVSPSTWWSNGDLLQTDLKGWSNRLQPGTKIYIGVGKEGLAPSRQPHVMEVDANLLYEKLIDAKANPASTWFDYLPEENHATIGHIAVYRALVKMAGNR